MNLKANKIRVEIVRQGLTQTALASKAGLSRECVNQICRGASCSAETAAKLAAALGVPLEKLEERGCRS